MFIYTFTPLIVACFHESLLLANKNRNCVYFLVLSRYIFIQWNNKKKLNKLFDTFLYTPSWGWSPAWPSTIPLELEQKSFLPFRTHFPLLINLHIPPVQFLEVACAFFFQYFSCDLLLILRLCYCFPLNFFSYSCFQHICFCKMGFHRTIREMEVLPMISLFYPNQNQTHHDHWQE